MPGWSSGTAPQPHASHGETRTANCDFTCARTSAEVRLDRSDNAAGPVNCANGLNEANGLHRGNSACELTTARFKSARHLGRHRRQLSRHKPGLLGIQHLLLGLLPGPLRCALPSDHRHRGRQRRRREPGQSSPGRFLRPRN